MAHGSSSARLMTMLAAAALALAAPVFVWAQDETAAVGAGKVLDIVPKVLDIVGVSAGIEGTLADLGAKVTEKEIKIALSGDILFDFDKDTLRPDAFPTLEKVAQVLSQYPGAPVVIEGHTDSKGKEKYNQNLSERRAKSVKDWLVKNAAADGGASRPKAGARPSPPYPMKSLTAATTPMAASRTAAWKSRSRPDSGAGSPRVAADLSYCRVRVNDHAMVICKRSSEAPGPCAGKTWRPRTSA
jgi:outer membrane protein OmpA-like peptidoglycan-associated protein